MNSEKIKILHMIASPSIGGAEKLLLTLSKKLNRKKFDVVLGIFTHKDSTNNLLCKEVVKLGLTFEPIRIKNAYGLTQILDIYGIIKKHRPDLIHTHGYKTNMLGFVMAKIFRIPILTTVHGWMGSTNSKTKIILRVSLKLLRYFDRIITVSNQIANALKEMNVAPQRILTIKNVPPIQARQHSDNTGSFRDELGIPSNSKIVGFVGRLERVKGCLEFLRAAVQVSRNHSDVFFVIVGEGSERRALEDEVKQLDLEKYVYFCGFRSDIIRIFRALDLYVLSSHSEGIPLTLLEAMCLGIPVVATMVGGVPEVIQDRVNGVLVAPHDPNALADSIVDSLTDKEQTARRIDEAKKTIAKEYNTEKWIETIEDIYLDMVV